MIKLCILLAVLCILCSVWRKTLLAAVGFVCGAALVLVLLAAQADTQTVVLASLALCAVNAFIGRARQ